MSSFGSISAMITSLKNNKIPKREHKLGHLEFVKGVPIGKPLKFKNKMSNEEIKTFRQKLKKQKRRSTGLMLLIIFGSLLATGILIVHYLY